ncbi:MAG: hypothetical protein KUG78_17315 [Kangiellaceae bacterium]|nr:hypothetical protein [Kangiellaceae bacterium]
MLKTTFRMILLVNAALLNSFGHCEIEQPTMGSEVKLSIEDMGHHVVTHGKIFRYSPQISGRVNLCRKDLGHDDVQVDSLTGDISWDTSKLAFGRGFHIRIRCSNYSDYVYASMVVHIDRTGKSKIRVLGESGVSKYISAASQDLNGGDTLIIPDGEYPVSVSHDASYENALKMVAPTDGKAQQFTTIIADTPGGVVITGQAQNGIGKQKNAIQLSESYYVAIVGLVLGNVQRESFTTSGPGHHLLVEFVGAGGAGTWGFPCDNFKNAKKGQCSNAGMRVNGGTPLIQSSYDWGHNRYGIMTRSSKGSVTRRSFVRLDEHRGAQPYGGFSDYCDKAHLNQDNTVFDSLAIAAPHYKNYAGLAAFPATGCEKMSSEHRVEGLMSVNNDLSLSLMDSRAGQNNIWTNIVSYDTEGTCTPAKNRCGAWLVQSKKKAEITDSYFGKARGFQGSTTLKGAFSRKNISLAENVIIDDVSGMANRGTQPEYLPLSQLFYNGRSDTFWGDIGFSQKTNTRRWPIAGEDIMASNMRRYSNKNALKVGGGTVEIIGNRGAVADNTTMSEYFWSYTNRNIPPLVVRVATRGSLKSIRWEHFSTKSIKSRVTGWVINCADKGREKMVELARLPENQLAYNDKTSCRSYSVQAEYGSKLSGFAYIEN